MEHKISQKDIGVSLFKKEAVRKEMKTVWTTQIPCVTFRAIQGHSGGIPIMPELMGYTSIPYNWKEHMFSQKLWSVQSILGSGLIPGGKESDKARQAVFFTPLNPFGANPDEEEPHDDYAVHQKVHYHSHWKRNQDAVYWIKFSKAQDFSIAILANKVICDHHPQSCARRLHLQSNL